MVTKTDSDKKIHKKRTAVKIIIPVILVLILAGGCIAGWLYINRFDAGEYVQAVLDTSYKNETDLYTEITGVTREEAEQIFQDNLDATMSGFEDTKMPEQLRPQYRELFRELAGKVSYTVGKPEKGKNGIYKVPVMVKPVTVFPDTYSLFQTKAREYAQGVTEKVTEGGEMPSDDEMQNQIYQIYYDVLRQRVDSGMLYGGAQEIVLHVTKKGSRTFSVRAEDMEKLDSALIEDVRADNTQKDGSDS